MSVALFDIGSGSVGLSLVEFKKGDVPVINFLGRETFYVSDDIDVGRILPLTFSAIERLRNKMDMTTHISPEEIHCFLSSHLVMSKVGSSTALFDEPQIITKDIIHKIAKGATDPTATDESTVKIEDKIMQVKLNGYETGRPIGHMAKEITVSSFSSFVEKDFLGLLIALLRDLFPVQLVQFHSFALSSYSVTRDISHNEEFLVIDVGSEITEVSVVLRDGLESIISFPHGKSGFLRSLRGTFDNTHREDSELKTWARDHFLPDPEREDRITNAGGLWMKHFAEEVLSRERVVPKKVFMTVDENSASLYGKLILSAYNNNLWDALVRQVDGDALRDFVKNKSGIRDDHFLMSEAIFMNKILYD
ncbi:MAG: hypothetical protein HZA94_03390 [Candidatus Vogelbacteria bacterium]|nr:hypothetical protein [Candidatus Vogelbacteria bacterium]